MVRISQYYCQLSSNKALPIAPRGTKVDELNASIKSSVLWHHVKTLQLSTNMRSRLSRDQSAELFAGQLLKLDEGRVLMDKEQFPTLILIFNSTGSVNDMVAEIFPNLLQNYNSDWIFERAILTSKDFNNILMNKLPGEIFTYNSIDIVVDDIVNYPIEFLNSLQPHGTGPHRLRLKKWTRIMLLRNLTPPKLCNGIRLIVHKLTRNCIETNILTGCGKCKADIISHIPSNFKLV
ncbi:uncharacterized protein LOC115212194 [Octopus sinensis]|uniref:ATP-dependent DNA helicase n=1 Tax=Octopus sinensis TaxID=2607531 RepID=A0A6P7SEP6_9MOLL|nr:uncharacterized protein LOC115212194 [Octopus sinensis]